jgi:hypothetical protein
MGDDEDGVLGKGLAIGARFLFEEDQVAGDRLARLLCLAVQIVR